MAAKPRTPTVRTSHLPQASTLLPHEAAAP
jgi:hypothetical protein